MTRLTNLRELTGLTQTEFAKIIDISVTTLAKLEVSANDIKALRFITALKISIVLNISVEDVLLLQEEM